MSLSSALSWIFSLPFSPNSCAISRFPAGTGDAAMKSRTCWRVGRPWGGRPGVGLERGNSVRPGDIDGFHRQFAGEDAWTRRSGSILRGVADGELQRLERGHHLVQSRTGRTRPTKFHPTRIALVLGKHRFQFGYAGDAADDLRITTLGGLSME